MDEMLGQVLANYTLVAKLGRGGMGTVFLGKHLTLQKTCAIKILRPDLASDTDVVERFNREAQVAHGLRHPNIVQIHDVGQQHDHYFIVMDLLEGASLRDIIRKSAPMPLDQVVPLLAQL